MSWIERDDLVRLIAHAVATPALAGPVNATAPVPVDNRTFTRELARVLGRPREALATMLGSRPEPVRPQRASRARKLAGRVRVRSLSLRQDLAVLAARHRLADDRLLR
jgi:nucleoside-diphosphate-sugar epimerase